MTGRDWLRIGLDLGVFCLFAYAAVEALSFSRLARYMPLFVAVTGAALTLVLLAADLWRIRAAARRGERPGWLGAGEHPLPVDPAEEAARLRLTGLYLLWMVAYIGLIAVVGLPVATALYLLAFLTVDARLPLLWTAVSIAAMLGLLFALTEIMSLRWPSSLLGW